MTTCTLVVAAVSVGVAIHEMNKAKARTAGEFAGLFSWAEHKCDGEAAPGVMGALEKYAADDRHAYSKGFLASRTKLDRARKTLGLTQTCDLFVGHYASVVVRGTIGAVLWVAHFPEPAWRITLSEPSISFPIVPTPGPMLRTPYIHGQTPNSTGGNRWAELDALSEPTAQQQERHRYFDDLAKRFGPSTADQPKRIALPEGIALDIPSSWIVMGDRERDSIDAMGRALRPNIFEIGGSIGRFLSVARWRFRVPVCDGCEINTEAVRIANTRMGLPGMVAGDFESYRPSRSYDCIVALDYIEHAYQPNEDLAKAYAMLKPGGVLVLKTFLEELDPDMAMVDYPWHSHHFFGDVLYRLITQNGFVVVHWGLSGDQVKVIARKH